MKSKINTKTLEWAVKPSTGQKQGSQVEKKKKKKGKTARQICWDAFSLKIRLKYADENGQVECYTCPSTGNWEGDGFMAGHLVGGRGNAVYVNEDVVRVQCSTCNMWHNGEQYKFGKRMESEIGIEETAELFKLKDKTVHYGKKDWKRMTSEFIHEARMYADEKGLNMPKWTKKYV